MSKHYMYSWKLSAEDKIAIQTGNAGVLDHCGSNRLKDKSAGDVIWFVHQFDDAELPSLVGKLEILSVVSDSQLVQEAIGRKKLFRSDTEWFAIANSETVEPFRKIPLSLQFLRTLRFRSDVSDKVKFNGGKVDFRATFRNMRAMDTTSAGLLEDLWYRTIDTFAAYAIAEDLRTYEEGRRYVVQRKIRSRSRELVKDAKEKNVLENGVLKCEVCGFDFMQVYGELGTGYIEAHHTEPLANTDGEYEITVNDLNMLCANCHRMIHRETPPLSVEKLKQIIEAQKS